MINKIFGAAKAGEREDGLFDRDVMRIRARVIAAKGLIQPVAGHDVRRHLGDRNSRGLGDEGHGAARPRVYFQDVDVAVLYGELYVHQADDTQTAGQLFGLAFDFFHDVIGQRMRWQRARGVARMNPRLLDVLHDARDQDGAIRVADGVHVDFDGISQIGIDEDRIVA